MRIYCINLAKRTDRWNECLALFQKFGMEVERFEGIEGNPGHEKLNGSTDGDIGCTLSHYELVKKLKAENIPYALIIEDDVEFSEKFDPAFLEFMIAFAPKDWDMIYLGGNHVEEPAVVNTIYSKVSHTYTTHAYIIRNTIYDKVIELHGQGQKQVDVYYAEIQKEHNCYVTNEVWAWQRESYSDIQEQNVHYKFLNPDNDGI